MQTTLDRFGRVVIPKQIRDELGIRPGAVLTVEERGHEVVMKPMSEEPHLVVKQGVLVYRGESRGDLADAVASHRRKWISRLGRGTRK